MKNLYKYYMKANYTAYTNTTNMLNKENKYGL